MRLEQQLLYEPRIQERGITYFVVTDLEKLGASVFYTNEKIVDLKFLGIQMHFHEDKDGKITNAKLKDYQQRTVKRLSNYEAAMGDLYAQQLGLPRIDKGSRS